MSNKRADLVEMFSSVQGEGILVGRRQLFLRFSGCNLNCSYCDTPLLPQPTCRIEESPGGNFVDIPNPVALDTIASYLKTWLHDYPRLHHSLSITGGEPLLNADLLSDWLPLLHEFLPVFLETNGTLPEALGRIINNLDYISMDIKIPSTSGYTELWELHRDFLALAVATTCYVKTVVSLETSAHEIEQVCNLIATAGNDIPLILQPVTSQVSMPHMGRYLLELQSQASRTLTDVRIIPQLHTFLQVL
ncbi:MAG: radical SAM protein [Geobacter sp.]|nr:radical SAM protein [Geobacter sp.]